MSSGVVDSRGNQDVDPSARPTRDAIDLMGMGSDSMVSADGVRDEAVGHGGMESGTMRKEPPAVAAGGGGFSHFGRFFGGAAKTKAKTDSGREGGEKEKEKAVEMEHDRQEGIRIERETEEAGHGGVGEFVDGDRGGKGENIGEMDGKEEGEIAWSGDEEEEEVEPSDDSDEIGEMGEDID